MTAMVALRHPLSGTLYEQTSEPPGAVRVTGKDGKQGVFDATGRHLSGERRVADMAMCRWVADGLSTAELMAARAARAGAGARKSTTPPVRESAADADSAGEAGATDAREKS
jgi:hypothetical protein